MRMQGWDLWDWKGRHVDTLYYAEACSADYIRAAEDIPSNWRLTRVD